jgi:hypothetical protein
MPVIPKRGEGSGWAVRNVGIAQSAHPDPHAALRMTAFSGGVIALSRGAACRAWLGITETR